MAGGDLDLDFGLDAGLDADQAGFEPGHETVRTDLEFEVGHGPAVEFLTVDAAGEIDQHLISGGDRAAVLHRLEFAILLGHTLERDVDFRVLDGGGETLQLELREIGIADVRHQLDREGVFEIGAVLELDDLDLGLGGGSDALVLHRLLPALLDRLFQHLAAHAVAETALEQVERNLAGTKARHLDRGAKLGQLGHQLGFDVVGGHHDGKLALQPLGAGFGDLHRFNSLSSARRWAAPPIPVPRKRWCGRRDSNPQGLRHRILNPACLPIPPRPRGAPHVPQRPARRQSASLTP